MNPLRYFLIPLGALVVLGLILTDEGTDGWVWLIVAPIILMAGVVSLGPQIKWWYWMRNAPDLPTAMAPVLERFSLYHSLDIEGKREFRRRAFLWRERINFQAQGVDKIPEDVQLMVAASATTLSFYRKDFLLGGFDSIVFYPHRFPSPQYEVLHASELYVPDGTMIFTIPYFVRSVFEPKNFLQLGLYEFSRAYQLVYPGQEFQRLVGNKFNA